MYRRALETHRARGDRKAEGAVLISLGAALSARGRYDEAAATLEAALEIHRSLGDGRAAGVALNNLGAVHLARGEREAAALALGEALETLEAAGESRRALEARLNLASLHHEAGRLDEATALAEQGALTARAFLDSRAEGVALSGLAAILAERVARGDLPPHQQPKAVHQLFERAARIHEEARQPVEEAHARAGLAAFDLERRGYAAASSQLTVARDLYRQADDTSGLGWTMALLAVPEAAGGRFEPARRALGEAASLVASDPIRRAATSVLVAAVALAACKERPAAERTEAEAAARAHVAEATQPLGHPPPSAVRASLRIAAALVGRDVFGPLLIAG